jgi:hypothetical protein
MHATLANLEIKVLEKMYLNEVEVLKLKLLSGAFWKDIKRQNDKTLELAQTIHQKQFDKLVLSLDYPFAHPLTEVYEIRPHESRS